MTLAYSYIRFSSEKQALGDSLRRQIKGAEDYAAAHGLTLDTHSYRDLGISAFKGKNAEEGRLGVFLEAVRTGHIPRGSHLLIENFDRLSRNEINEALTLFLQITNHGIVIVTVADGNVYTRESINKDVAQLIGSILHMGRAHEESKRKAFLVKKAWDANRAKWDPTDPKRKLISRKCPAWLNPNAENNGWIEIPERVAVVRRIYSMALRDEGQMQIVRALNADGVPKMSFDPEKSTKPQQKWSQGIVGALLRSRAPMGTFVQKQGGDQVIENYFPGIITKNDWLTVQARVASRVSKGQPTEDVRNLFTGISYCLYCGSRTKFTPTSKGYAYVRCRTAYEHTNGECKARPFPYLLAEVAILDRLMNAQFRILDSRRDVETLDERALIDAEIDVLRKQQAQVIETQLLVGNVTALAAKLKSLQDEIEVLERRRKAKSEVPITEEELRSASDLYNEHERLKEEGGSELHELRRSMQSSIRRTITKIEFGPNFQESKLVGKNFFRGKSSGHLLSDVPDFVLQLTFASGSVRVIDVTSKISPRSKARREKLA